MSDNKNVCKPGFNDCGEASYKEEKVAESGVCKPGFNTCDVSASKRSADADKSGDCKPGFNTCSAPASETKATASSGFDKSVFDTDKVVILYFSAPWCTHCQALAPVVDQIMAENKGVFELVKINIEEQPDVAEKFEVDAIPVLITVKDSKIVGTSIGGKTKEQVEEFLGIKGGAATTPVSGGVCKPGFNDCGEQTAKEKVVVESGVCKPGFNNCDVTQTKKSDEHSNGGVCKPGFNDCN